ncbi:hypothetical protein GGTG_07472 [Gaeumannomyces tritici R3-111a-1]|uniref:Uncharacterized protein n=1 Tax=Gaeumannomyces tritici (strain R3-111a-1) TaxID=644352 RepID=J3P1S4_GAET3|nr:hypothetical protein GGTG_07472 [Gaeumannomyces tritici R3-111a-1]EJT73616.1 hypothetical protein GGTG_07472 [Gaeumannomyces tritici R3-111a-1]
MLSGRITSTITFLRHAQPFPPRGQQRLALHVSESANFAMSVPDERPAAAAATNQGRGLPSSSRQLNRSTFQGTPALGSPELAYGWDRGLPTVQLPQLRLESNRATASPLFVHEPRA